MNPTRFPRGLMLLAMRAWRRISFEALFTTCNDATVLIESWAAKGGWPSWLRWHRTKRRARDHGSTGAGCSDS
jgi:hypothetical protein